jgi:ribosomal protein S18 acetylase RimI-like enzyme
MPLILRAAIEDDAMPVAGILIDTRATFMKYAPSAHTEAEVRTWVAAQLLPSGGVLVVEECGEVIALMATSVDHGTSWITQMAVAPSRVGQGVGAILLEHAFKTLARPIRLYAFQQNTGARRFYERNGFRAVQFTDGEENEEHCPDILYELCTS